MYQSHKSAEQAGYKRGQADLLKELVEWTKRQSDDEWVALAAEAVRTAAHQFAAEKGIEINTKSK